MPLSSEVPTPCRSISLGSKLTSSQVTLYHRLNRRLRINHRCIRCILFREHVLVDLNSSSAPVEPMLKNQPSVHWMYYVPESLFELISEPLQHRLNRCPYRSCIGAMTQAWILCQNPQWLLFGHRETGWTDAFNFSPVGSSDGHDFSAVDFQRLCDPLHSI